MRYFKRSRGEPFNFIAYYEFDGEHAKRQIEVHPETVLLLSGFSVTEALLSELAFDREEEITQAHFDELWAKLSKLPHGTRRSDSPFLQKYLWGVTKGDP